jgi:hypothetical protein
MAMRVYGLVCIAALVLCSAIACGASIGTAFTYQGWLKQNGQPVDGKVNLEFKLYDQATGGTLLGEQLILNYFADDGLIIVELDFGDKYNGDARWLEVEVNSAPLDPRQRLYPTPHALYSVESGGGSGGIEEIDSGSGITVTSPQGPTTTIAVSQSGITSGMIQNGAVMGSDIASSAVDPSALKYDAESLERVSGGLLTISGGDDLQIGASGQSAQVEVWGPTNGPAIRISRVGGGNDQGYLRLRSDNGLQVAGEDWLYLDGGNGEWVGCVDPSSGAFHECHASVFVPHSARASKRDIRAIDETQLRECLDQVLAMDPVTYRFKWDADGGWTNRFGGRRFGLIADDLPNNVTDKSGQGVDLYALSTTLIGALQQVEADSDRRFEELRATQDAEVALLESRIEMLEAVMAGLTADQDEEE